MDKLASYSSSDHENEEKMAPNKSQAQNNSGAPPSSVDLAAEWESFEKLIAGDSTENEKIADAFLPLPSVPAPVPAPSQGSVFLIDTQVPLPTAVVSQEKDDGRGKQQEPSESEEESESESDSSESSEESSEETESETDEEPQKKKPKNIKKKSKKEVSSSEEESDSDESDSEDSSEQDDTSSSSSDEGDAVKIVTQTAKKPEKRQKSPEPIKKTQSKSRASSSPVLKTEESTSKSRSHRSRSRSRSKSRKSKSKRSRSRSRSRSKRSRSRSRRSRSRDRKGSSGHYDRKKRDRSRDRRRRRRDSRRSRSRDRRRRSRSGSRSHRKRRNRSRDRKPRRRSRSRSHSRDRPPRQRRPRDRHFPTIRGQNRAHSPGIRNRMGGMKKKPITYKEQLRQKLLEAQKQASEGNLDFDPNAVMLTPNEKPSPLPLMSLNPLASMAHSGGNQVTPQQALLQTMAAMHQKAQELTGVAVPKYYNPAAVNPLKFADQVKKRKLLWSQKKEQETAVSTAPVAQLMTQPVIQPTEVLPVDPSAASGSQWKGAAFMQDQDGKVAAKFRKLMGIKHGESSDQEDSEEPQSAEQIKKQQELFQQLDREYEFARMTTHTHRGIGLGFSSQSYPNT